MDEVILAHELMKREVADKRYIKDREWTERLVSAWREVLEKN